MDRRAFLSLGLGALAHRGLAQAGAKQPNLVLFMPDELRADALSCYGNSVCHTPNFDRFAAAGTRFEQCHVQNPICGPSRCALLSGRPVNAAGHRSQFYFLRRDEPNIFRYLKQAGYDVFWFGKNDALAAESWYSSVTRWGVPGAQALNNRPAKKKAATSPHVAGITDFIAPGGEDRTSTDDYRRVQQAIEVLKARQERPFCIFLPLFYPHPEYGAPEGFNGMHSPDAIQGLLSPRMRDEPTHRVELRRALKLEGQPESLYRTIRARYYDCVAYSDWLFGELLHAIDRTGHREDTAVFVFSDHGDYAGDYGLAEKWPSGLEDALTHVPLLARVPGGAAKNVVRDPVMQLDLFATWAELGSAKVNAPHISRSLVPQLHARRGEAREAVFAEGGFNAYEAQAYPNGNAPGTLYYPRQQLQLEDLKTSSRDSMIRTLKAKLIYRPQDVSELYVYADGGEAINQIHNPKYAALRNTLEEQLLTWHLNTGGVTPYDKDQRDAPPFDRTPVVHGIATP